MRRIHSSTRLLIFIAFYFTLFNVSGQQKLSQDELNSLIEQGKAMGYSDQELLDYAQQQGISPLDFQKFGSKKERSAAPSTTTINKSRVYPDSALSFPAAYFTRGEFPELYYGYSFFSSKNYAGFESNIQIATPENYTLGTSDLLYIDVFGLSEVYYECSVSPDGYILLENIGPVYVAGLTIESATKTIKSKLAKVYTGLLGDHPTVFLNVSLGSIRSIHVQIAGEVVAPGTYTVSSLSTLLNALHMCGGPTLNGTLRNIELYREGKLKVKFDLYSFLTQGISTSNIILKDNDVILVRPYQGRVELQGQFKRPGFYEILGNETVSKVLSYCGGFNDHAYLERILITRNLQKEKTVADIFESQFDVFTLKSGDVLEASEILNRYTNRVQIKGAVYRPGPYAYTEGITITKLIKKADGLTGDAYTERGLLTRTNQDLTTGIISFNIGEILDGKKEDILLQKEDVIWIQSIFDLEEERFIKISGEVNNPGIFPYSEGVTVRDLIFKASGLTMASSNAFIEISRRSKEQSIDQQTDIIQLTMDDLEKDRGNEFALIPFDHVMVRKNPNYFTEKLVKISGEVVYPGTYALMKEQERLSDIIQRSGGFKALSYAKGATLIRRTEFFDLNNESQLRRNDLNALLNTIDTVDMTESDIQLRNSLITEISRQTSSENENFSTQAKKERLTGIAKRNALSTEINIETSELIPLNLEAVFKNPGSPDDLILQEGDIITIPKKVETIRLRGRVLYPTTVKYIDNKSLRYFIDQAGGFDSRAIKRKTYVLYPNGEVARTKSFLVFRSYPSVEPGSEVIIPAKPIRPPVGIGEYAGIGTSIAALLLAFSNLKF